MSTNPIFQYNFIIDERDYRALCDLPKEPDHLFYFWDETWAGAIGPYNSYSEAMQGLKDYDDWLHDDNKYCP